MGLEGEQRYVLEGPARSPELICRVRGSILLLFFVTAPALCGIFNTLGSWFGFGSRNFRSSFMKVDTWVSPQVTLNYLCADLGNLLGRLR